MPTIPTYTAPGSTAVVQLPSRRDIPAEGGADAAIIGGGLQQIGNTVIDLANQQKKAADEIQTDQLEAAAGEKRGIAAKNLAVNPDDVETPDAYLNQYKDVARSINENALAQASSPNVRAQLTRRFARAGEHENISVYTQGIEKKTVQMVGKFDAFTESQVNEAAAAPDPTDALATTDRWRARLATMKPFLSPVEYTKREQTFRTSVFEKRADLLTEDLDTFNIAREQGQFEGMAQDRLNHWQRIAQERNDQKEAKLEKATRQVHDILRTTIVNQAALGILDERNLADAVSEGALTQKDADTFRGIQLSPPDATLDHSVDLINDRFVTRPLTKRSIAQARNEYTDLLQSSGKRNDKLSKNLDSLSRLELAVDGANSAKFRQDFETVMSEFDAANPETLNASPLEELARKNQRRDLRELLFKAGAEDRTNDVLDLGRNYMKQITPAPKDPTALDKLEDKVKDIYKNLPRRK